MLIEHLLGTQMNTGIPGLTQTSFMILLTSSNVRLRYWCFKLTLITSYKNVTLQQMQ